MEKFRKLVEAGPIGLQPWAEEKLGRTRTNLWPWSAMRTRFWSGPSRLFRHPCCPDAGI